MYMEFNKVFRKIDYFNILSGKNNSYTDSNSIDESSDNTDLLLNELPVEILDHIFSYLPKQEKVHTFPKVCRAFRAVSLMDHNQRLIVKKINLNTSCDSLHNTEKTTLKHFISQFKLNPEQYDLKLLNRLYKQKSSHLITNIMNLNIHNENKFSDDFYIVFNKKNLSINTKLIGDNTGKIDDYRLRMCFKINHKYDNEEVEFKVSSYSGFYNGKKKAKLLIWNTLGMLVKCKLHGLINYNANKIYKLILATFKNMEDIEGKMSFDCNKYSLIKNAGDKSPFCVTSANPGSIINNHRTLSESEWTTRTLDEPKTVNDAFELAVLIQTSKMLNAKIFELPKTQDVELGAEK